MAKFKLTAEGVLNLVTGALRGWKPKRIKRALKQVKRHIKEGKNFCFDDDVDAKQITDEEFEVIIGHREAIDHGPGVQRIADDLGSDGINSLPAGEYTGDISGMIGVMIEEGTLDKNHKVSDLLKKLRKTGRLAAADLVQMALNRFNGDVNESCRLSAFCELLDKAPPRREMVQAGPGPAMVVD